MSSAVTAPASAPEARRPRWPRWATRTQVERVDLYTRQSLYLLLWLTSGLLVVSAAPQSPDHPRALAVVAGVGLVLTAVATVVMRAVMDAHVARGPVPRRHVGGLLGLGAACLAGSPLAPTDLRLTVGMLVWSALAWALGGLRGRRATVLVLVALTLACWLPEREPFAAAYGLLAGGFLVFTVRASLWLLEVVTELDDARGAQAALAVAEERLRFSRDVHDVLGRRLATISVQAELAATLAARGDERAADRILEVRGVAHEALREARELARGYRTTDLGQELQGARSLLRSAGIQVVLDVDALPPAWHEAAGWVVREAVTNVLRHSRAGVVEVRYAAPRLTVRNDGALPATAPGGSGLAGLAERLLPLGGRLTSERDGECFTLVADLPGAGPTPPSGGGAP